MDIVNGNAFYSYFTFPRITPGVYPCGFFKVLLVQVAIERQRSAVRNKDQLLEDFIAQMGP